MVVNRRSRPQYQDGQPYASIQWRNTRETAAGRGCPDEFAARGTPQPAAAPAAAPAASSCILTARYQPSATIHGSSASRAAAESIPTLHERWNIPPTFRNRTSGFSLSVWNSKLVIQKLVLARNVRPSASRSVPPAVQVLFVNSAISASLPAARTVTRALQNPTRLNVQLPSAAAAVAREPNALRNVRVATTSSPSLSSNPRLVALGWTHSSSRPASSCMRFMVTSGAALARTATVLRRSTSGQSPRLQARNLARRPRCHASW